MLAFVLTGALTLVAVSAEAAPIEESACTDATPTKSGTSGADKLIGTLGADVIRGLAGNDTVVGSNGADLLCGDEDSDRLLGGFGNDRLVGGDGKDTLDGDDNDDALNGGGGDDTLNGGNNKDTLNGGFGDDVLDGGNGPDELVGGTGHDTVTGGIGNDTIDTFDGESDHVACGLGTDVVKADTLDVINSDCEQITRKAWGPANFAISPTRWDYGFGSSSHTFTVTNKGPGDGTPDVFLGPEWGPPWTPVHFTIEGNTCISVELTAGQSCTVVVRFTPESGTGGCVGLYANKSSDGLPPPYAFLIGGPYRDQYGQPYCPFS